MIVNVIKFQPSLCHIVSLEVECMDAFPLIL
jgi:hypothetical protein